MTQCLCSAFPQPPPSEEAYPQSSPLPSPASTIESLTREFEHSLDIRSATKGQYVVKPQVSHSFCLGSICSFILASVKVDDMLVLFSQCLKNSSWYFFLMNKMSYFFWRYKNEKGCHYCITPFICAILLCTVLHLCICFISCYASVHPQWTNFSIVRLKCI